MRLAIMQPYFLPYIGYFQLLAAVDRIVLLDDVNFIKGGWINRNRIAGPKGPVWITVPLDRASPNRLIREIEIVPDNGWQNSLESRVRHNYGNAPFLKEGLQLLQRILAMAQGRLAPFLAFTITALAEVLQIDTDIIPSSSIYPKEGRRGQERILDICRREGASAYINLPGGRELYDESRFAAEGIELRFLDPCLDLLPARPSEGEVPNLSILDLLMNNDKEVIQRSLLMARLQ
jgi:hypothetical protein